MVNKRNIRKLIVVFGTVAGIAALGAGVFYGGYAAGRKYPETIIVKGITNIGDNDVSADFGVFWQAWKELKQYHVDAPSVQDKSLVYGAITGLTNAYKDPNTTFFPPDDSKKFQEDIQGSFGGIGAEIGERNNQLVVIAPLKSSPSERAGLKSGDKILKINGTSTVDIEVDTAVKFIRGPIGTTVVLNIFREGWRRPKDISVIRDTIVLPNLDWEMKPGGIAHVKLYNFNQNAVTAFYEASAKMLQQGVKGIILDLRNNPGGFLDAAVSIAGLFVERDKVVASEEFRSAKNQVFKAAGNPVFLKIPVVVLINGGSASASEILAGALRDDRGASLVGERSFGKGTVQELHELSDHSQLKITIAHWLLPNGRRLEKNGLMPDVEVKISDDDAKAGKDPQFEKALQMIREEIAKQVAHN